MNMLHADSLKDKDAEIERLKTENFKLRNDAEWKNTLITELADALVMESPAFDVDYSNLIQRARKATK